MILPVEAFDLMIELRSVICPATNVKNSIVAAVSLHQESCDLYLEGKELIIFMVG